MAYNSGTARPFGLRPIRYKNGTPWNGAGNWYYVPSTDGNRIGMFEPVAHTGTAEATTGRMQVTRYTAGAAVIGVAIGFLPYGAFPQAGATLSLAAPTSIDVYHYRPASTAMWVLVADDPNIVFMAQEDGDTTPIAVASVGYNANFITAADCSTTTGLSVCAIDSDTVNTTATLNVKVLGLNQEIGSTNTESDSYNVWDVIINSHSLAQGTGSTGT